MAEGLVLDVEDIKIRNMPIKNPPPDILEAATDVVDEVISKAELEVISRKEETSQTLEQDMGGLAGIIKRGTRWHNRARGIVTRILTHLRICK